MWSWAGGSGPRPVTGLASQIAGLWVVRASITTPRTNGECLLTLLSQPEGASIEEMMQATKWQQHSVRGFLAGTVKRKLGFSLTSSKLSGDVRRYRIETRRGR